MVDAIELLKQQHREVDELFEKFEKASEGKGEQVLMDLFARIADNLAAHAVIEEKIFYPSVYVGPTADKLQEAVEEHLAVKRVIADLLDMDPSDVQFKAKMKVLQEMVEHHVEEEEKELFKSVKKLLAKEELVTIGEQMEVMFNELIQTEPRMQVPRETDEAAPLPQ
ncbi:hemerythrin HHE cation binding domain-containing protein [Archangium gephyra]|uniref:Hemerythrin HHE cation binding domain protein n=1 Tax=Archangium gephyra TaxID=48 RepID=A0AAC8QHM0_9BACT|nr:Hemerythrin HHE cation binding domain protein [Archangium gephyra]REG29454.1 hemerythrin HHE cation binding domain-containing protein [Archangium gephyra]